MRGRPLGPGGSGKEDFLLSVLCTRITVMMAKTKAAENKNASMAEEITIRLQCQHLVLRPTARKIWEPRKPIMLTCRMHHDRRRNSQGSHRRSSENFNDVAPSRVWMRSKQ